MTEESKATTLTKSTDVVLAQSITIASIATVINQQIGLNSNTKLAESVEKIAFTLVEILENKSDSSTESNFTEMKSVIQSTTQLIRLMDINNKDAKNE